MAVISIPSSIGGVAIPGVTNGVGGPLAALFGSSNGLDVLQYPRDLGSSTKGHWIQFTPFKRTAAQYDSNSENNISPYGEQNETQSSVGYAQQAVDAYNKVRQLGRNITDIGQEIKNTGASQVYSVYLKGAKTPQLKEVISLYMPDSVAFQYNATYNNTSLTNEMARATGIAGNIAGKVIGAVGTGAAGALGSAVQTISKTGQQALQSDVVKLALSLNGLAINPQQQMLFDGVDFRRYQLAFTFTPYSAEEAKTVKEIIKIFRKHAAPTLQQGYAGIFWEPPSTFELDFKFNGASNPNITKVKESVIETIDVDYSPNGWSTFGDGAPVQTILTLGFKEVSLVDHTDIKAGY